jgi:uncharacterized membrane protein
MRAGERPAAIDRAIVTRGLIIAALDPIWISPVFTPGLILLQVLFAIGISFVCMIPLRRLSSRALLTISLGLMIFGEALIGLLVRISGGLPNLPVALLLSGGQFSKLLVGYPLLPWLAVMSLGWTFGRYLLLSEPEKLNPARLLGGASLAALALFAMVRGTNGYGNLHLLRDDQSLVHWLHVSKYPPSLSFYTLELGLMALILAALFRFKTDALRSRGFSYLLVTFGQTAFFFYLLHAHLLRRGAWSLGMYHAGGLPETIVATVAVLVLLFPCCRLYRRYKLTHPHGWARYI